jgi:hypothetical protein
MEQVAQSHLVPGCETGELWRLSAPAETSKVLDSGPELSEVGLAAKRGLVILELCHRSPKVPRHQRVQVKTQRAIAEWP